MTTQTEIWLKFVLLPVGQISDSTLPADPPPTMECRTYHITWCLVSFIAVK